MVNIWSTLVLQPAWRLAWTRVQFPPPPPMKAAKLLILLNHNLAALVSDRLKPPSTAGVWSAFWSTFPGRAAVAPGLTGSVTGLIRPISVTGFLPAAGPRPHQRGQFRRPCGAAHPEFAAPEPRSFPSGSRRETAARILPACLATTSSSSARPARATRAGASACRCIKRERLASPASPAITADAGGSGIVPTGRSRTARLAAADAAANATTPGSSRRRGRTRCLRPDRYRFATPSTRDATARTLLQVPQLVGVPAQLRARASARWIAGGCRGGGGRCRVVTESHRIRPCRSRCR